MNLRPAVVRALRELGLTGDSGELTSLLLLPRIRGKRGLLIWLGRRSRSPVAFGKLALDAAARRAVGEEVRTLSRLHLTLPDELAPFVPDAVIQPVRGDQAVAVQRAVGDRTLLEAPSTASPAGSAATLPARVEASLDWLHRFHTRRFSEMSPEPLEAHLWNTVRRIQAAYAEMGLPCPTTLRAGAPLGWWKPDELGFPLPRVRQHGDFAVQNLVTRNGAFSGVVDWEEYGQVEFPLYDLWTFGKSMLSERAGRPASWAELREITSTPRARLRDPSVRAWATARDRFLKAAGLESFDAERLLRLQVLHWIGMTLVQIRRDGGPAEQALSESWLRVFEGWLGLETLDKPGEGTR